MTENRVADTPLSAVLQGKPAADDVPVAAWLLIADSLQHSVLVRRALEGVAILAVPVLRLETNRARLAALAALEELGDEVTEPLRPPVRPPDSRGFPSIPALRATSYDLARLIVSPRVTSRDRLCAAIHIHLEALRLATQAAYTSS